MLFGGTFLIWQSVWVNRSRRAHGCQFSLSLFVAPQILLSDIYACCHSSLLNRKTHANAYHNFPSIFMIKHKHSQSVCFTVCEWMSGRKGNSIRKLSSLHCIRTFAHKYATHFFLSNESFFFLLRPALLLCTNGNLNGTMVLVHMFDIVGHAGHIYTASRHS